MYRWENCMAVNTGTLAEGVRPGTLFHTLDNKWARRPIWNDRVCFGSYILLISLQFRTDSIAANDGRWAVLVDGPHVFGTWSRYVL